MDKPLCNRCGVKHWRFVACEQADELNAREAANTEQRERAATPEWLVVTDPRVPFGPSKLKTVRIVDGVVRLPRADGRDNHNWRHGG